MLSVWLPKIHSLVNSFSMIIRQIEEA